MPTLLYAEIKLKADMKDDFLDLINSPEGFSITKSKPGFISAETAMSADESGQHTFHLWEKWEIAVMLQINLLASKVMTRH